jgi:hypothetical protein
MTIPATGQLRWVKPPALITDGNSETIFLCLKRHLRFLHPGVLDHVKQQLTHVLV